MKQYSRIGLVVLIVVAASAYFLWKPYSNKPAAEAPRMQKVVLGGQVFMLEVADTPQARERGLSGRGPLGTNDGMLFVFDQPDRTCFWMKDVTFPIDILWFDQDTNLVHIKYNATPASYPESFCSPTKSKYVVELQAGTAKRLGIEPGSALQTSN